MRSHEELPLKETTLDLFAQFLKSPVRLVFPVLDRVLFPETIKAAYELWTETPTLRAITAKACVFAFLSIKFTFLNESTPSSGEDGDIYALKAEGILNEGLEEVSIVTLQTALLLVCVRI